MNSPKDPFSYSVYPNIRADLIIVPQVEQGIQTYMVKDPISRTYHRVGEMEYAVMTLLDGQNSLHQIQEKFEEKTGGIILEAKELERFLKFLREADHLEKSKTEKSVLFYEKMRDKRKRRLSRGLGLKNMLAIPFPALDPDKFFDKIIHPLRFFWSKGFLIFSLLCFLLAVLIASSNWQAFKEVTFGFYSFEGKGALDYIVIWALFFVIVAIHELAHGLTCKHYGGEVHELGLILYYFEPCFYCQVDDSYLFKNKSHRIAVMVAGAYSELVLCSFAVFVWWLTPPHLFLHHLSAFAIAITGVIALIFNFNPLMKYDGYYILGDYLEVLNLRGESFKYIRNWLKKKVFKKSVEPLDVSPRVKKIYTIYGVLALLYSGFVIIAIFFLAKNFLVNHFHIWGILILLVLAFLLLRKSVRKLWKMVKGSHRRGRLHVYLRNHPVPFLLGFLFLFYVLFLAKIDWQITKDFTVEPKDKVEVRTSSQGFVREVLVKEGDEVAPNQLLAMIRNDSLQNYVLGLRSELAVTSQRMRGNYLANDVLLLETNLNEKQRLEIELKEAEKKLDELKICAPIGGKILTPKMEEKEGLFLNAGEILCELADLSQLQAKIYLSQWEIGDVKKNNPVELKISSHSRLIEGRINQLSLVPHQGSTSVYEVRVDGEKPEALLKPGMTGKAKIHCDNVSLPAYLYKKVFRSLRTEQWK